MSFGLGLVKFNFPESFNVKMTIKKFSHNRHNFKSRQKCRWRLNQVKRTKMSGMPLVAARWLNQ